MRGRIRTQAAGDASAAAQPRGFTMIEVLIVVALFSVIGVSLFQCFATGLKVWKAATQPNFSYRRAVLCLERLGRELRQQRTYPNTTWTGRDDALTFASVIHNRVYNITYAFDKDAVRREAFVVGAGPFAGSVDSREVIPQVRAAAFSYWGYDPQSGGFAFSDEWTVGPGKLAPDAVRVTLELDDGTQIEKLFYVPVH
ncbi:MAG: prepilin-type N-terminal cleavage/methylation domain-containing protein [Deltaproteobacteria bacterium]